MSKPPKVSVALPVFNGENYLAEALDSILAQTFRDFELVISDNASTDATPRICAEYAARDARVVVNRNARDVGPCKNFDLAFELSSGEYFKWAAHDDLLDPTFLEKCVAVLDADAEIILCHSLTRIIDDDGNELAVYDSGLRGASSSRQSRRFAALILSQHICTDMFGLMRADALRKSVRLEGNYHGCDRFMLAELALIGRFAQLPEPLFLNREHAARYVRAVKPRERGGHHRAGARKRIAMNWWRLYGDYRRAVAKHAESLGDRLRCHLHLVTWWFVGWNALRAGAELIAQVFPGFYDFAKGVKNRFVRPAHPVIKGKGDD